ncbi:hypothetical protein FPV67DRAFT_1465171 [Lyophyllum atratum]|nr:hypothetical protein FPV67DRAFT_1465171 [Lyophyllum atratum]
MHSHHSPPRSHFIDDLIPVILESDDHWWPRDLHRLAQVSSAWLGPVRRRLFAVPSLHSFQTCSQLARALSNNTALLSLVKGVELRPMLANNADDRRVSPEDSANLKFIFALEGLEHVTLGGLLAVKAEKFLHAFGDPQSVLHLHIDGSLLSHSLSIHPSLEWDESIAFQFTHLKTLRLTSIELDISYPSIPYQLQLSMLQLDHVTIMSGYLSHLLHETPSVPHLSQVRLVLDSCAIETLEYEVETDASSHHHIFDGDPPFLYFASLPPPYWCSGLDDLGRMVTILPCEWISFITAGHLPRLRSLGLPWGTKQPPFVRWLLNAAAPYNIRVLHEGRKC